MATFEEIQKANEAIKTTGIEKTNKKTGERTVTQYAPVNQRVKAFRMVYPMGRIETQMLSNSKPLRYLQKHGREICVWRDKIKEPRMTKGE